MVMGGIGLTFKGKGLDGLFSKVGFLKEGFGRFARKLVSKLVNKSLNRTINNSLRSEFNKLFKEKEPAYIEEE
jgi:hypothetical protein